MTHRIKKALTTAAENKIFNKIPHVKTAKIERKIKKRGK